MTDKSESWWKESLRSTQEKITPHNIDQLSDSSGAHIVLEVDPEHISTITRSSIKIPAAEKIIENYSKRQIPRFRWAYFFIFSISPR